MKLYHLTVGAGLIWASLAFGEPVLDLGHTDQITMLKNSGNYLVSGTFGRWILWDLRSHAKVLTGSGNADFENGVLMTSGGGGYDIYTLPSLVPIHVTADSLSWIRETSDGNFAYCPGLSDLTIWKKTGPIALKMDGNFNASSVTADSSGLYVSDRGVDSLICIPLPQLSPVKAIHFEGRFNGWLVDGKRFQTRQDSIVRTYDNSGKLEATQVIPNLGGLAGQGNFFWDLVQNAKDGTFSIYQVGQSNLPVRKIQVNSEAIIEAHNGYLVISRLFGGDSLILCKLEKAVESCNTQTEVGPRTLSGPFPLSLEITPEGKWFSGNGYGLIAYGESGSPAKTLARGSVINLIGDLSGRMLALTSNGQILVFHSENGALKLVDSLTANAEKIKLSANGTRLVAYHFSNGANSPWGGSISVIDMATHALIREWKYPYTENGLNPFPNDFDISQDGSQLGQSIVDSSASIISDVATGQITFKVPGIALAAPRFSPDGKLAAFSSDSFVSVYAKEKRLAAFRGRIGGWIRNDQIAVNRYSSPCPAAPGGSNCWTGAVLGDTTGKVDSSLRFPEEFIRVVPISDSEAALVKRNSDFYILNLKTGETLYDTEKSLPHRIDGARVATVGTDFIAFQDDSSLSLINWRQNESIAIRKQPGPAEAAKPGDRISLSGKDIVLDVNAERGVNLGLAAYSIRGEFLGSFSLGRPRTARFRAAVPLAALLGNRARANASLILIAKAGARTLATARLVALDQ